MKAAADAKPRLRPPGDGLSMVLLMAVMTLLLALLLVLGSEGSVRPSFAYSLFMASSTALSACGALLSRSEFVATRQWLRARVAPVAGLELAADQHLRQLLGIWLACAVPVLLVSNTVAQGIGGPLTLALLMVGIAAIAEWGQLQKPLLQRARAAWAARWHWLDATPQPRFSILGFMLLMLMQTGSPDTAHSGLPQWGETLDWRYLLRLAAFGFVALHLLQSPDLHWRRLLAPGTRRRQIGARILWASLKGNLAILAFCGGLALAIAVGVGGRPWARLPSIASGLLPDLLLSTMLAVTLRGFAGGRTASLLHLLAASAGGMFITWFLHINSANPTWHRDGWHALAMAAVMLLLLPLMRRAWLRADLVQLAAEVQEPPEPTGWKR